MVHKYQLHILIEQTSSWDLKITGDDEILALAFYFNILKHIF